jgi:manganese/zinc/iron transport system substrate-binding protein
MPKPWSRPQLVTLFAALLASVALAQVEPLRVVATTGMVGDTVAEVGGACVAVTTLMGPGIDPHLYRASAGDVERLQRAELIVVNGLGLEGQLGSLLTRLQTQRPALALAEAIIDEHPEALRLEDGEGADPHLWLDAALWSRAIDPLVRLLVGREGLRPDCAEEVIANAERFRRELLALDAWMRESIASIPEGQRLLVTSHDAFGYFGAAYGIEVAAIEGISTESEASIADIREIAELVASRALPAIFIETTVSPRTIEAVQAAVRDRGGSVAIGGELYGDALGEAGSAAGTLIGMLLANVILITEALGGVIAALPTELAGWASEGSP